MHECEWDGNTESRNRIVLNMHLEYPYLVLDQHHCTINCCHNGRDRRHSEFSEQSKKTIAHNGQCWKMIVLLGSDRESMAKVMLVTFVCFFRRTGRSYLSHSLSAFNGASDLCVCVWQFVIVMVPSIVWMPCVYCLSLSKHLYCCRHHLHRN